MMDPNDPLLQAHSFAKHMWDRGVSGGWDHNFPVLISHTIPWLGFWPIFGELISKKMLWEK